MQDQVRLAIVPSYPPGPLTVEAFCSNVIAFTDFVASWEKVASLAG